jgi:RimJ/RimL family protein N-acetyltransferase
MRGGDRATLHRWGAALPPIDGARVGLRGLQPADARAILDIFGDADVTRFWSSPPLGTLDAARDMIADIDEGFRARRVFQWGICLPAGGPVMGTCTLFQMDRQHRRAEVGIALHRAAWGQGIAAESLRLLIAFAFDTLKLHRLEADIDPDNQRSLKLFEGLGFRREGHLRQRWHHLGEWRDSVFLALLQPEWAEAREAGR